MLRINQKTDNDISANSRRHFAGEHIQYAGCAKRRAQQQLPAGTGNDCADAPRYLAVFLPAHILERGFRCFFRQNNDDFSLVRQVERVQPEQIAS